jgi:hypothetical protein
MKKYKMILEISDNPKPDEDYLDLEELKSHCSPYDLPSGVKIENISIEEIQEFTIPKDRINKLIKDYENSKQ